MNKEKQVIHGDIIAFTKEYLKRATKVVLLVHGCNCFSTMGAGVAKLIKDEWPIAYEEDVNAFSDLMTYSRLGNASFTDVTGKLIIGNLYTQYSYGSAVSNMQQLQAKGHPYYSGTDKVVMYDAIDSCFRLVKNVFKNDVTVIYPMIGAGLARGHWPIIDAIIDHRLDGTDRILVKYNG